MTAAEIDAARTPAGGWTRETLTGWGVLWPPAKGWRRRLIEQGDQQRALSVRYCFYCDAERDGPRCSECGRSTR